MAEPVPETVTVDNMSGTYTMNTTLSDSSDAILALQGVSWLVRTAISYSSVTMTINQYEDEGVIHLDQEVVSTGGMTNTEERTLVWEWKEATDKIFGHLKSRSRYLTCRAFRCASLTLHRLIKFSEVTDVDPYLKQGWDKEIEEGNVFQNQVESISDTWTATQIWGYGIKDGVRRHMRKAHVEKGDVKHNITMYYDWKED